MIVATQSEATYVLDEILGNATDLPISEHVTDTGGVTLVNFACFDLVDKQFSPRIRDLGKIALHRIGGRRDVNARWPHAGPLLTTKANTALIAEHWDNLLRLGASLKYGRATASLVVGKLCASTRQNAFAAALKEYGALRRTIHAARYLTHEDYRRRIGRQLNKGYGQDKPETRSSPGHWGDAGFGGSAAVRSALRWGRTWTSGDDVDREDRVPLDQRGGR